MSLISTIPIFVNGNASNSSSDGSVISYFLDPPLNFGNASVNFKVLSAEVYYTFPNISATKANNQLLFVYNAVSHTIVFENGLYNIDSINQNIREFCIRNNLPDDLFLFSADPSTSKVSIEFAYPNITATLGTPGFDIGQILGWDATAVLASNTNRIHEAPQRATLNQVNRVLVHASFANGSYFNNQGGSDVVANIQINVGVGRQINYAPNTPYGCSVYTNNLSRIEFYITDENGRRLDTAGEYWGLTGLFEIDKTVVV